MSADTQNINGAEALAEKLKEVLIHKHSDPNGPVYQSLRKMQAKCLLRCDRHYEAAYSLVEALAPSIRTMAAYRVERKQFNIDSVKQKMKIYHQQIKSCTPSEDQIANDTESDPLLQYLVESSSRLEKKFSESGDVQEKKKICHLDKKLVQHAIDVDLDMKSMRDKLIQLPKEWTVVQLTAGYEASEQWQNKAFLSRSVKDFYVTVLKGQHLSPEDMDPFTVLITPDIVKYGERPLFEELHSTLEENLRVIENTARPTKKSLDQYWEMRGECDQRMKSVICTMDKKWLGPWRCLLAGRIVDSELEAKITHHIEQMCESNKITLTKTQRMLISKLAGASHYTSPTEVSLLLRLIYMDARDGAPSARCVCGGSRHVEGMCVECEKTTIAASPKYKNFRKVMNDLVERIKHGDDLKELRHAERGPVILLVDEKLDMFPWEVLPVLNSHPVTRMECLSLAHALYCVHQEQIQDGYYQLKPDRGRYLINPGGDLERMEKRMSAFMDYWCPNWQGDKNNKPPPEVFQSYLQESDIFLYCGHNDGSQYIGGGADRLEGVKAVTTLSGCGSVRLRPPGTRLLAIPVHAHYHIATCPSVVGMLWEVTDLEVDKVTSMLLGLFLPAKDKPHWGNISKANWTQGVLDATTVDTDKFKWEPDLLKALACARRSTSFVMIAASAVARGIPVKIHSEYSP